MSKLSELLELPEDAENFNPMAVVRDGSGRLGIAVNPAVNSSLGPQEGRIIVFWRNGDITAHDYLDDIVIENLWEHLGES